VPVCPRGAAPFPAALPAAHEQVRMLRLTPVQRGWDETAPSVVRLVKGSRMEGMIVHVVGQVLVCQRRDLRWNLTERGQRGFGTTPTGQVRSRAGLGDPDPVEEDDGGGAGRGASPAAHRC
jgi:hypothetical protein